MSGRGGGSIIDAGAEAAKRTRLERIVSPRQATARTRANLAAPDILTESTNEFGVAAVTTKYQIHLDKPGPCPCASQKIDEASWEI